LAEPSFHYDKFYEESSDSDKSEDSYRDLYYNRDNFSKLNKEKEETVDKEEEVKYSFFVLIYKPKLAYR
jgi:hypothetical protein